MYQFLTFTLWTIAILLLAYAVFVLVARSLFRLPQFEHKPKEMLGNHEGYLCEKVNQLTQDKEDLTGIKVIRRGIDAFTLRLGLIKHAQISIDAKYYVWQTDLTGLLLLSAIREAADRGVKVRMLLDDNGMADLDAIIHELNQHEMIDIRLYNPFVFRTFKVINLLFDFFRLNRRMHNKALIVDGVLGLSGGRNIGDEYFGFEEDDFVDLDVLTVGQVMPKMNDVFELFYQSNSAVPAESIISPPNCDKNISPLSTALQEHDGSQALESYTQASEKSQFKDLIESGTLIDEWTQVKLLHDLPRKTTGKHKHSELMAVELIETLKQAQSSVFLVTPYFIPGEYTDVFVNLSAQNINLHIRTNSFKVTDSATVHAAYVGFRKPLLEAGIGLSELKVEGYSRQNQDTLSGFSGSLDTSLHAKTFCIDQQTVFIGSFNFDPRSIAINTEMGMLISSHSLANQIHDHFNGAQTQDAYELQVENGGLIWLENLKNGSTKAHHHEPLTTKTERLLIRIIGRLPINRML